MIVSEIFGPTIQGEGPSAGRRCAFVRLGRCNLTCSWCDTPYTWDWRGRNGVAYDPASELTKQTPIEVADAVKAMGVTRVVVTGGEPLLQMRSLEQLTALFAGDGLAVEIETNGTRVPTDDLVESVAQFNVSPKLSNSGMAYDERIDLPTLRSFVHLDAAFKFVARSSACLAEVSELQARIDAPNEAIWIMPEATASDALVSTAQALADEVIASGWNMTGRMHVSLWGDERGR